MKKFLTSVLVIGSVVSALNAGDKRPDLVGGYLDNTNSVNVKRLVASDLVGARNLIGGFVASDSQLLFHHSDLIVHGKALANPNI